MQYLAIVAGTFIYICPLPKHARYNRVGIYLEHLPLAMEGTAFQRM